MIGAADRMAEAGIAPFLVQAKRGVGGVVLVATADPMPTARAAFKSVSPPDRK